MKWFREAPPVSSVMTFFIPDLTNAEAILPRGDDQKMTGRLRGDYHLTAIGYRVVKDHKTRGEPWDDG